MTWYYDGVEFTESDIGNSVGFIYLITNRITGRKYVGRKLFTKSGYKQKNGKRKKIRVSSDWQEYFGSNLTLQNEVKEQGSENFHREILHLCYSLSECSYLETMEIFKRDALLRDDYYNDWVMSRVRKANLKRLIQEHQDS